MSGISEATAGEPQDATEAEPQEKRRYRISGKVKLGDRELELYCSVNEAAQLLGVSRQQVIMLCGVLGKTGQQGGIKITAQDLYEMVKIAGVMKEFECTARTAVKISARLNDAKKAQAA